MEEEQQGSSDSPSRGHRRNRSGRDQLELMQDAGEPGKLVVPPTEDLQRMLVHARETGTLTDLREMIAAWQAVAEHCKLVFDEMLRLAVFRLEVERELGGRLAQTVKRGGDRPKSRGSTLVGAGGLPEGISRNQSSAYQQLAAVPEKVFHSYVEKSRLQGKLPSSSGARRFARAEERPSPSGRKRASPKAERLAVPAVVLDIVSRVMTPDVVVGEAAIQAKLRLSASASDVFDRLRGDVFVAECPDPDRWLAKLLAARDRAVVDQAIVLLPLSPAESWFSKLADDRISICLLRHVYPGAAGWLVVHIGQKAAAFCALFRAVGVAKRS